MERFLKSRYKIGEKISENPFSVTYKGVFAGTDKPVIIKIYKRGTLSSSLISRMKQKVREISLINHHGMVKLLDGDYGWQGFYYVREFVEGKSLRQVLQDGRGPGVEKAVTIAEEICRLLEIVHARGIIHGALKPSNIIIDPQGIVKVVDFVIEGEIKEAMPQKVLSLMEGGGCFSPEELAGVPASASSDVYALGAILFEMLAEKKALPVEKGLKASLEKLGKTDFFNLGALAHSPRYIREIVSKALQNDPLKRFSSMAEFRESLENKGLVARPVPHEEFISIFENTVTEYGGEEVPQESESVPDSGRVSAVWGKEKNRTWFLGLVLAISILLGLVYAFFIGR